MTPLTAAWRVVRVALERQRIAALEVLRAVDLAEAAGIPGDGLLAAVRLEYEDWDDKLHEMQLVAELLAATGSRTRIDALVIVDEPIASHEEIILYQQDQGFLAYHCNKTTSDNPYSPGDPAGVSWRNGWLMGRDGDRGGS